MMQKVTEQARAGSVKEALWTCNASLHPAGAAAAQVLKNASLAAEHQEERLEITLSEQRLLLDRNLGVLGTMGNTAPLIGLLGTVWGIMRASDDMARSGSAGPSVVAAGVAEALLTPPAGLLVAVPAVLVYNHLVRRMGVMLADAENHARRLRLALDEAGQEQVEARPRLARVA